jgi:hypothetical protein
MKARHLITLAVAALAAAVVTAAALADDGPAKQRMPRYDFTGHLLATPTAGGQLSIAVDTGSRNALRAMLGQSDDQSFSVGPDTEFLKWSKGVPTIVQETDLAAGDVVNIHVRAAAGSTLAQIETQPAGLVGDVGPNPQKPDQPLYLFRGKLDSVSSSTVTIDVAGGDRRALRLMIGQSATQSFAYDSGTIFLLWQGKVPTVISPDQLKAGDTITVRVRAKAKSSLQDVESTPAAHVGDHEPASK